MAATSPAASGAVSGACSTLLLQPLDVIKTRLQQGWLSGGSPTVRSVVAGVLGGHGPPGLWSGVTPALLRVTVGAGLYFELLVRGERALRERGVHDGVVPRLGVAAAARTAAGALTHPLTVFKTRVRSAARPALPPPNAAAPQLEAGRGARVAMGEGRLTAGFAASMARDAPFAAIYYAAYSHLRTTVASGEPPAVFACGLVAGVTATAATHPFDVWRTRLQLGHLPEPGGRGMQRQFRGLWLRAARRPLASAITWTLFDVLGGHKRDGCVLGVPVAVHPAEGDQRPHARAGRPADPAGGGGWAPARQGPAQAPTVQAVQAAPRRRGRGAPAAAGGASVVRPSLPLPPPPASTAALQDGWELPG